MTVYFGTYTKRGAEGIYRCRFDADTGRISAPELAAKAPNPSFVCLHPSRPVLYATGREGRGDGQVSAFAIDTGTGALKLLNTQPAHGTSACYVSVDPSGKLLMAANYGTGSVVAFPIADDGSLGEMSCQVQHEGSSVHKRQKAPHAHSILPDPKGAFALAADLGLDRVLVYRIDVQGKRLVSHAEGATHPGAGPRHIAIHPGGKRVYVVNELDSTLTGFDWDADAGKLTPIGPAVSTVPADYAEPGNTGAHIQVSADGRFVYSSNRGHHSIFIGAIDAKTGRVTPVGWQSTEGRTPRHFSLDPTGRWLLAANQDTDNVAVLAVDPKTGKLSATGRQITVGMPVCVCWAVGVGGQAK